MRKFLSIVITGLCGIAILASASTAYASEKNMKFNFGQFKKFEYAQKPIVKKMPEHKVAPKPITFQNIVAFISNVDTTAQTVSIRRWKDKPMVANKAIVVVLTTDGAKVGTLADLKVGYKTTFWLKKTDTTNEAVIIMQDLNSKPISWPSATTSPTVKFSSASASGLESVSPVSIPVTLSAVADKDVTVSYTVSGTAIGGGVDYTLANGTLTIPKGQTTGSLSLAVVDNTIVEPNETVVVTLSSPSNATLGSTNVFTYTINDNDQPTVGFNSASGSALKSVASLAIPVTLSAVTNHDVTVSYTVTGTATGGGVDYTLPNGTITIPAGSTSANINLALVNNTVAGPDKTVVITLSGPTGATLASGTVFTQTILENAGN
jgi:hypothetical protein